MINKLNLKALSKKDLEKAAEIIAEAFMDYPLPGGFIEDKIRRKIVLKEMFGVELRRAIKKGSVIALSDDFYEVAIFKHSTNFLSEIYYLPYARFSTLKIFTKTKSYEMKRLNDAMSKIIKVRKSLLLPKRCVELYILAVHPEHQGEKRVSSLIKPVLNDLRERDIACLVVTNTLNNLKLYEHLGFKLVSTVEDKENGLMTYFMLSE